MTPPATGRSAARDNPEPPSSAASPPHSQPGEAPAFSADQLRLALRDAHAEIFRLEQAVDQAAMSAAEAQGRERDLDAELRFMKDAQGSGRSDTSASEPASNDLASVVKELKRAAAEQDAARRRDLANARRAAEDALALAERVLTSSSWKATRALRILVERMRGRRWTEPTLPKLPWKEAADGQAKAARDEVVDVGSLAFPDCRNPRVTIIVPTYGNLPVTARCLRSLQANPPDAPYEILLVEDRSGDPEIAALAKVPGLRYRENDVNLGFLRSCNGALEFARGEFVCFLNNDTEVAAGWLDGLVEMFERFPDCGLAGSKLLSADGTLQEAGGIIWADASGWNFGRGGDPAAPEFAYVREVDYCSGAALMIPTGLIREMGGFDERYAPAYYEDADLAFRVRERGLKVYYCPTSVVTHLEGVSHGTDLDSGVKAYQVRNRKVFRERWRHVLDRRHYRNGECVFRAREHARHKLVVLVMDHTLPQTERDAGSRAMLQTMVALRRMGMVVKFWPDDRRYDDRFRRQLEDAGVEIVIRDFSSAGFEEYVREFGQEIDFAVLSRPNFAGPYIELLREYSRARIALYGHDIHHLRMLAQAKVTSDPKDLMAANEMRELECRIWSRVDSIIYPSEEEARIVAGQVGAEKVHAVPLYCFDESELQLRSRAPGAALKILFVAGFGHPPNEDAAEWLVRDIFPRVRASLPGAVLHLVGSNPTRRVMALASPMTKISSNVSADELAAHYATASVAIAPLRFGGGVKLKVVEAMARGVPMVTTSVGAQGLPGIESCISVSDDAAALAGAIVKLVTDESHADAMIAAAHQYLRDHYSRDCMERALWRALVPADGGGPRRTTA